MGEDKRYVFHVGCPSFDLLTKKISKIKINKDLVGVGANIEIEKKFILVVFHPVTTEYGQSYNQTEKIIKAISDLNSPLINLNIIGDGPELNQLQKISLESNNKDNIIFHGKLNRDEIDHIFLNSDIYIQASNYEGLPHSLLEAMSYGIPVLCTPVGECKEILGNEDRGYILDLPVSKNNIKSKISQIIGEKDIANKKGEKGKDFINEKYNLTNSFNLYKNLFTRLLEEEYK